MNLFEINKELYSKLSSLDSLNYDEQTQSYVDSETGEVVDIWADIMSVNEERKSKLIGTAFYIKELESEVATQKEYAKSLAEKIKIKEKRIEWLKANIVNSMIAFDDKRVEDERLTLTTRKTVAVEVTSMELLPKEYIRETVKIEPNKTEIKKAIQSGEIVAGAELKENVSLIIK